MRNLLEIIFFGLALIVSCKSAPSQTPVDCDIVFPLEVTTNETDISRFISDVQLLKIENDTLCPFDIRKIVVVNDSYIALSGGCVFKIANDGTSVSRVGNVGRGPGEYLSVKDMAVDFQNEEILCLDVLNNILHYSLFDKGYKGTTVIEQTEGCAEAIVPLQDNLIAVYFPNPPATDEYEDKNSFSCLRVYDYDGNVRESMLPWSDYNIEAAFSIPSSFSGSYCVLSPESYTPCLFFGEGVLKRRVLFDFGKKNVPAGFAYKKGDNPMLMIGDIFDGPYYKLLSNVFLLPHYTYFRAFGDNCSMWNFIITDNNSGIRWESIGVASPPVAPIGVDGDYLLFPYNDYGLVNDEKDPIKRSVIDKYGLPEANVNTMPVYLIKVKFDVTE